MRASSDQGSKVNQRERPRVLVVDDEPAALKAMCSVLRGEFEVTTAVTGEEAIELIHNGAEYDVVSMDVRLPGVSGVEALEAIKRASPESEVLLVTGHADVESAKKAIRAGAYDYIDKPIRGKILKEAIRRGVTRRSRTRAAGRAQTELTFVRAQLERSKELSVAGTMLRSVLGELNYPLSSVVTYAELLMNTHASEAQKREWLTELHKAALVCHTTSQVVLGSSKLETSGREAVPVSDLVSEVLSLKSADLHEDSVQVQNELPDDLSPILGERNQLQLALLNVVQNAHEAMKAQTPDRRNLTIEAAQQQQKVSITIGDTGPGIPEQDLQRIFDPFFTTRPEGGGGLGLSISCDIVAAHAGDIYVASQVGSGSRFVLEFPAISSAPC